MLLVKDEASMAHRLCSFMILIVVAAVTAHRSDAISAKQQPPSSFCTRAEASRQCANPPTVDADFNVEEYLGRWYEIGSTATFKLLSETGLICNQAFYSSSSGKLSLLNSGLTVISPLAAADVSAINFAGRGSCAAAREVCYQLPALVKLSQSKCNPALRRQLASSVKAAGLALHRLASDVSLIQQANGEINQANYPSGGRTLQSSVADIKKFTKEAEYQQDAIAQFAAELNKTRAKARKESAEIQNTLNSAALKVSQSSAAIEVGLNTMKVRAKSLLSTGQPINNGNVYSVPGTITQPNATSPAKLEVSIFTSRAPYWIIALEKAKDGAYSAALIYSCQQGVGKSLFVLSREPTMAMATLHGFLSKAESLGIYNDCEDPFLLTLQRGGTCGRPL
ncbi:hypothetical protein KP509_39G013500 [Ceratopteris richardii]|uniref:Lipocalin/cytosolic fatty-acid binding domain-containing protein n=1 Tax=Ceratopteris richardii TaxID=49495 RepID=A0A8T2PYU5_CERRI|nr:hypothetical protein KP509_39G013500 [Ceratopteris richardii]